MPLGVYLCAPVTVYIHFQTHVIYGATDKGLCRMVKRQSPEAQNQWAMNYDVSNTDVATNDKTNVFCIHKEYIKCHAMTQKASIYTEFWHFDISQYEILAVVSGFTVYSFDVPRL